MKFVCSTGTRRLFEISKNGTEAVLPSSIVNMAKTERIVTENPCEFIRKCVRKKIPARVIRNRYLTLEVEKGLFEKLSGRREHIATAVRLPLLTGMRRGEILGPRWEHVNLGGEAWEGVPDRLLIEKSKTAAHTSRCARVPSGSRSSSAPGGYS